MADDGVRTSEQYNRFRGIYPRMGRGFPRRYVDETPDEILYNPTRILGDKTSGISISRGATILRQPRLETEARAETTPADCKAPPVPFPCPAPQSQLPYIKMQTHIEPSRDAEIFFLNGCADIPASADGVNPGKVTVFSFDTLDAQRFSFKWSRMFVFDALCPSLVTVAFTQGGINQKYIAQTSGSVLGSNGLTYNDQVSLPTALDFQDLPDCCRNSLFEIIGRQHVDIVASNLAMVDRKIEVSLWGWIEQLTVFDNQVQH